MLYRWTECHWDNLEFFFRIQSVFVFKNKEKITLHFTKEDYKELLQGHHTGQSIGSKKFTKTKYATSI